MYASPTGVTWTQKSSLPQSPTSGFNSIGSGCNLNHDGVNWVIPVYAGSGFAVLAYSADLVAWKIRQLATFIAGVSGLQFGPLLRIVSVVTTVWLLLTILIYLIFVPDRSKTARGSRP